MIIPKLALRSLVRNRKSSLVLIGLVAVGVFLFLLGDAVLGVAATGIREEFQGGYTGDLAIRARFERKFGIFGFSVPTIGEYEEMPTLGQVERVKAILAAIPGIKPDVGLVSGAALLEGPRGRQIKVPVFGVNGESYFRLFPALDFISGASPKNTEPWIVLSRSRALELEKLEKKPLAIGDSLQFTMASGTAFTIRAVRLAGIVDTPMKGNNEYAAVYTDAGTLRALLGLGDGTATAEVSSGEPGLALDLEGFFSSSDPSISTAEGPRGLDLASSYLKTPGPKALPVMADPEQGAWHFLLSRVEPGISVASVLRQANKALAREGIDAEAVGWLPVAGLNASILYLLKTVFEIGIGVLAGIVVLVLANGLAFSVIEQTREIGAMRAMGAQQGFVSRLFLLQSCLLVLAGTLLGGLGAWAILSVLETGGIPVDNAYLRLLFGSSFLRPAFRLASLYLSIAGGLIVAAVASIYPMGLAMRTSVVQAMSSE